MFPFYLRVGIQIMMKQSVVKALTSGGMGGCASSAPAPARPIDIASSIVDMDIRSLKLLCSDVIDKFDRKLEQKESEDKDDKNGKRKRD